MANRSLPAAVFAQRPNEADRQTTEGGILEPLPGMNQILEIRVRNRPGQERCALGLASG